LGVIVQNGGVDEFIVTHGLRIAQLIIAPVVRARFVLGAVPADTHRGTGGFGSTGAA
jgi:dUTP pyrophosphatase